MPIEDPTTGEIIAVLITNVSNRLVCISIDEADTTSDLFPSSGLVKLNPGRSMTVEDERTDFSQLVALEQELHITTTKFIITEDITAGTG